MAQTSHLQLMICRKLMQFPANNISLHDELDPTDQDGLFAFDTSSFQNTILGTQTGMLVNYFDETGNST